MSNSRLEANRGNGVKGGQFGHARNAADASTADARAAMLEDDNTDSGQCCNECGGEMEIDEVGVSHHLDADGGYDYDADGDHTAMNDDFEESSALLSPVTDPNDLVGSDASDDGPDPDDGPSMFTTVAIGNASIDGDGNVVVDMEQKTGEEIQAEVDAGIKNQRVGKSVSTSTPWGKAQWGTKMGPGINSYSCAGHGGIKLSPTKDEQVHPALRTLATEPGWYEEDCAWAVAAHTFPEHFTTDERRMADEALRNWSPNEYTAATGKEVKLEESSVLRRQKFQADNANNQVTTSATMSKNHPGKVEVTTTTGGKRSVYGQQPEQERRFLVTKEQYDSRGENGYVIDESNATELGITTGRPL